MELTRRDFIVLAATAPLLAHVPGFVEPARAEEPPRIDEAFFEELPIQGFAGECSGRF